MKLTVSLLINFSILSTEKKTKKTLSGNQAPFMTKELGKEIYTRSKLKDKYKRNTTKENKAIYKKAKK